MTVMLIAGPPAVGHNTIADAMGRALDKIAVVDVDDVRSMVRSDYRSPWEGADGAAQHARGVGNACQLARNFEADGYDVLILDVATPHVLDLYREHLSDVKRLVLVLLHAEAEILVQRDIARNQIGNPDSPDAVSRHNRIRTLRDELVRNKTAYGFDFDTGTHSVEESVAALGQLLDQS